jgi:hypothetical protein
MAGEVQRAMPERTGYTSSVLRYRGTHASCRQLQGTHARAAFPSARRVGLR